MVPPIIYSYDLSSQQNHVCQKYVGPLQVHMGIPITAVGDIHHPLSLYHVFHSPCLSTIHYHNWLIKTELFHFLLLVIFVRYQLWDSDFEVA